jgi:putative restriction endonuclease
MDGGKETASVGLKRLHAAAGAVRSNLLDKGFVSFENSGELIISPVAHKPSLERMGVVTDRVINVGSFTEGRKYFLNYHRGAVLLRAVRA